MQCSAVQEDLFSRQYSQRRKLSRELRRQEKEREEQVQKDRDQSGDRDTFRREQRQGGSEGLQPVQKDQEPPSKKRKRIGFEKEKRVQQECKDTQRDIRDMIRQRKETSGLVTEQIVSTENQ